MSVWTAPLIATQLPPTAWHAAIGDSLGRGRHLRSAGPSRAQAHLERSDDARPDDASVRKVESVMRSRYRGDDQHVEAAGAVDAKSTRPQLLGKLQNSFPRASTGAISFDLTTNTEPVR